ncbi:unnamed protein product [Pylaiella littoralis]
MVLTSGEGAAGAGAKGAKTSLSPSTTATASASSASPAVEGTSSTDVRRSAVEDVLAALSLETSASSETSRHMRQNSKTYEVGMDENKVVMHTRRGSTAVGVTPSDPSAIVDLFQEVESIGNVKVPGDETGSTTDEDEDENNSSCHEAAAAASSSPASGKPATARQSTADSASSTGATSHEDQRLTFRHEETLSATEAAAAAAAAASATTVAAAGAEEGAQPQTQQQKNNIGAVVKLWGKEPTVGKETVSTSPPQSATTLNPAWGEAGDHEAPRPYWPSEATAAVVAAGEGGVATVLGRVEGDGEGMAELWRRQQSGEPVGAEDRRKAGLGGFQRAGGAWKLTDSEKEPADKQQPAVPEQPPARPGVPDPQPYSALHANSVSESQQAPLRRKTSMGSFQKGMGESLTGRLRKQLDIPDAPKREIDTNIPIEQIQSLKYLAQGAMCVAYTALLNGQQVVLKTPLPDTKHVEVAANDLEVEMLLLKELHHDNIVSLLGAGYLPDGRRFVALEFLSGGTLSSLLASHRAKPMCISKVLDLSLALCNALEYLHDVAVPGRIVCHRDLKPDNIGFAEDGALKVIDFGLGKIIKRKFRVRAEKYHMTGGTGSLRYMAPEIADHQEYNEKGDVYSFSLIMWEMLAGIKPFLGLKRPDFYNRVVDQGERPPLNPEWPQPIRNLLESCWRTNLDERLSFREVTGILKVCAEEENRRSFKEEKRKSIQLSSKRSRLWTTTGARPDLEEISADPQYKPKFKISSFLSSHNGTGGVRLKMGKLRGVVKSSKGNGDSVRRTVSGSANNGT